MVGTPINIEIVSELVGMLDIEAASPEALVRIYPVQHASATRLGQMIGRLFQQQQQRPGFRDEDRVIIESDERSNALVISTSSRSFTMVEHLLEMLDSESAPDLAAIRQLELEFASAARVAPLVQRLMDGRVERLRRVDPQTADLERVTIEPDPRTNSLLIAASEDAYQIIEQLVDDLDRSTLQDDALVEVISVELGNVERLAETIDTLMDRRYADLPNELRESQKPLVMTDTRSNALLVAANEEDLTAIRNLIAQLEAAPMDPAIGVHVIALEHGSATAIAPRIQRLMRDRRQSLGDAATDSDLVTIEPDEASNSLIVAAFVVPLSLILGLSGAILLTRWQTRFNSFLWWVLLSPMLAPGIVLGLSTLVMWKDFGVDAGLFVSSFICRTPRSCRICAPTP